MGTRAGIHPKFFKVEVERGVRWKGGFSVIFSKRLYFVPRMVLSWFEYQSCPKAEFCFYRSSVAWGIVCERFRNRRSGPISRKSPNTDFSLISVIWLVFINIYLCPKRVKDLKSVSNFIQSGELLHEILWYVLKSILARLKVGWITTMVHLMFKPEATNRKKLKIQEIVPK